MISWAVVSSPLSCAGAATVGLLPTSKEIGERYPVPCPLERMISTLFSSLRFSTVVYVWFLEDESCSRVSVSSVGMKKSMFPSPLTSEIVIEAPL